jgi:cytochrome d ubiquinol oxidase subunit II
MEATWYALLALMLTVYVVLDGFDFGAGIAHLLVAKTEGERRLVLAAIGPIWDGNEVWLIGSGGVLVFAFPHAYAAAFSGFYLPLTIVLWLLIVRGLSIEFRAQWPNPLWHAFFDVSFAAASTLLAFVLGVSFANVIRGVPVGSDGSFAAPLFGGRDGALDGYTCAVGLFAVAILGAHGAHWIAHKTEGELQLRARKLATRLWPATAGLAIVVTIWTARVDGALFRQLAARPWAWPFPLVAGAGFVVAFVAQRRGRDGAAFFGSTACLAGLLVATAAALFPTILRSTIANTYDVTAYNGATGHHGLAVGLMWWIPALLLAIGYFTYLFRAFAGKVRSDDVHY